MAASQLQNPIEVNGPFSLLARYLKNAYEPYANTAEVNALIPVAYRSPGMTALVEGTPRKEYWYQGGITDGDLVEKQTASSGEGGGFDEADY